MKHLKLFFALFAMLALGVGNAWAEKTDTYDFKTSGVTKVSGPNSGNITDLSQTVVLKSKTGNTTDTWTISFTSSTYYGYGKNTGVQFGSKNYPPVATMTSKSYNNVSKIEVVTTSGNTAVTLNVKVGSTSFGEKSIGKVTSASQIFEGSPISGEVSVSLTSTNKANFKIEKIIITYDATPSSDGGDQGNEETVPSLTPEQFSWSATTATATLPNTFDNQPTLTNTESLAVTYSSSNGEVATIDANGNVILVGVGTADIKATAGDDITFKKTTVYYTLTVNKAPATPTDNVYVKVTTTAGITDGEYLIVYEDASNATPAPVAFNGALATKKLDVASNYIEVSIASNTIAGNTDIDAAIFTIDATAGTIQTKDGYYIGQTSDANGLLANTSEQYTNTITIDNEGSVNIKSSGNAYLRYNAAKDNWRFRYFKSSTYTAQKAIALYKKVDPNAVVEPVFTPAAGEYYGTQSVTISCATAGAEVYYTLDGTDPTSASTKYTGAISITATTTVKAIAVKGANSSEVVSATYTILAPLATMQEIFDKATDATQSVHIKFNDWVISGVVPGKDGKPSSNAYITDGFKGFIIYTKDGHGFNVGNKLSGTVVCDLTRYNGSAEVVGLTSSTEGLTVTTDGVVTPVEVADKSTLSGVNTGAVIKITGVCETKNVNSKDYFYVGGIQLFNSLFAYDTPTVGGKYNVTGVYLQYNDIPEILPRSADDIEEINDLTTATISIADITMEAGETKTIEATITPDAAQSTVQYAITAGNEYITLNGTTITAVAAGTATITATIAEVAGEYYGATKTFNVTVKSQNIAELPFEFTGVRADIENTLGMSQDGLGTDYTTAGVTTNLKFDGTGDWVIIHFNGQADKLAYDIKGNGFSGGKFTVQQSSDGSTYTEVVTYTELGDVATKEHVLAAESRYVKFIYTTKSSGNVGLGNITISKPDNRQEAGLAWNPETVTLTVGDAFTPPTLSNPHSVSGITYESSNEAVAAVSAEGVIALVDDAVGTATITATFDGDATYKPATVTCTIQVKSVPEDCDGSDDFTTLEPNTTYGHKETENGWIAENAAVDTIGFIIINGKTSAVGTITSPELNGGIGSIKIRYANTYNEDNGVSFRLDIKQNDEVVRNYTITKANSEVVKGTVYTELIENINVEGDFVMVFTNLHPSDNSEKNKDRVSIGRLCWTGYEEEETLVLTEGENNLTNGATGDVTVNRSFIKDNLYTLSLPFALNATQVKAMFGPNTVLYQFAKLAKEGDELVLYFSKPSAIAAGTPYLIKPSWDVNTFVVRGATITTNTNNISFTADKTTVTMKPVLSAAAGAKTNGTTEYWLAADKYLYNNANTLLSLRALFEIITISGSGMPPRCRVALGENVETGVEDIITTDAPVKVIVNGQLIIIRDGVKYNVQGQIIK